VAEDPGKDKMVNGSIESLFKFWPEFILTKDQKKKSKKRNTKNWKQN
jgi:hypothetical protein